MSSTNLPQVECFAVWQTAKDFIKRYPQEPELVACQIANDALAAGRRCEYHLWQRVAKAVQKMAGQPQRKIR